MKKCTTLLFLLFIILNSFSQKQTAFWYFGVQAGLNFNSGNPIALTDSQMATNEGCATISDFNGNLLFYTDGTTVWNKNHEIMQNGDGLNGDFSSTNSAIVIPKPNDINVYYIFTVDDLGGSNGLQYSEVNMLLDGGLGGVTSNKNNILHTPTTEKVTAVKHQNDTDWWLMAHKWNSSEFTAYLVTNTGISPPIISNIGTNLTGTVSNTVGAIKFSPDGSKLAIANSYGNNHVQLLNFDDLNGTLSNVITLNSFNGTTGAYGVEFSLDSKLLYVTDSNGSIYQYNTELTTEIDIINSRIEIANSISGLGAIQIAPNGKIYVAKENSFSLGLIENPNILGFGSNYISNGVSLNQRRSKHGLPPFIQSFFWKEITVEFTCFMKTTQFMIVSPEVSQTWNFGDPLSGTSNTSTDVNPTHIFTSVGTYSVEVNTTNFLGEISTTFINVIISETPIASTPTDYILCDDDQDNDNQNGFVQSFVLSTKDIEILGSLDQAQYDVSYYEDANFTIQIQKDIIYENKTSGLQLIYVKIFNLENDFCFDTTTFNLVVNKVPLFDLIDKKIVCSNNLPDYISVENPQGVYDYIWTLEDGTEISDSETVIITTVDSIPISGLIVTVTATDPLNTCTFSKSFILEKFEIITLTQDDIIVKDLSNNNTILISPQDPNFIIDDYLYALDNGLGGGNGNYQNEPYFENVTPGIRTVFIKDKNECDNTEIEVSVLGFQKFFTPNNDGYNDTWQILGVSENFYASSIITIYDRFGKLISKINLTSIGWDGYYNGVELPSDDYWFSVEITDLDGNMNLARGHFSLIRR